MNRRNKVQKNYLYYHLSFHYTLTHFKAHGDDQMDKDTYNL